MAQPQATAALCERVRVRSSVAAVRSSRNVVGTRQSRLSLPVRRRGPGDGRAEAPARTARRLGHWKSSQSVERRLVRRRLGGTTTRVARPRRRRRRGHRRRRRPVPPAASGSASQHHAADDGGDRDDAPSTVATTILFPLRHAPARSARPGSVACRVRGPALVVCFLAMVRLRVSLSVVVVRRRVSGERQGGRRGDHGRNHATSRRARRGSHAAMSRG